MVANLAASGMVEMPINIFVQMAEALYTESILVGAIEEKKDQWTLILQYLKDNTLLKDPKEAQKAVRLSSRYAIDLDEMYMRSFSQPLLKYLGLVDTYYILMEVYERICGVHIGAKALTK